MIDISCAIPLNDVEEPEVRALVAVYAKGQRVTRPVLIQWRGRLLTLAGSHRTAALVRLLKAGVFTQTELERRVIVIRGDWIAMAEGGPLALEYLEELCGVGRTRASLALMNGMGKGRNPYGETLNAFRKILPPPAVKALEGQDRARR